MNNSRGGKKPVMIQGSSDLGITVGKERKFGLYELSPDHRVMARRVELPLWLSDRYVSGDVIQFINGNRKDIIFSPDSRGHVFLVPPTDLFDGPAVGMDMEPYQTLIGDPRIETVLFYVYAAGYRLIDIWMILADEFIDHSKVVRTKAPFMPQRMVPLSLLTPQSIPSPVQKAA